MRSLRRLSVVSIVPLSAILVLCSTNAHAQTAAAPPNASLPSQPAASFAAQIPPLFPTGQSAPQPPVPSTIFPLPPLFTRTIHNDQPLDTTHTVEWLNGQVQRLNARQAALLARNDGPCFALRTYGFTAGHDPAEAPRLSSHTTCTPASKSRLRELVTTP